ncbi:segregation/condensation protein A [Streptomyces sp. NBC_00390]|uniref:segregation and condensation protein A n=1 Tax=Streptomyces sp. NBC_00390 TaxID=2975736 RepID=UPI002E210D1D
MPPTDDAPARSRRLLGRGPGTGPVRDAPPDAEPSPTPSLPESGARPPEPQPPRIEARTDATADAADGDPADGEAAAPGRSQRDSGVSALSWPGSAPGAADRTSDGQLPARDEATAAGADAIVAPSEDGGVGSGSAGGGATGAGVRIGAQTAGPADGDAPADDGRFKVRLANFEGPFDLLLQLISKHKLDVTEVALSKVTDEFMAHIRAMGPDWDLDQTTEFLVVAATLLDLKAARLLPSAEVEDEADLALLEARDLLFARLLQYRAYKQIAEIFSARLDAEARRYPRTVGLEPHHADLLPDVVISIGAEGFARLAVKAMQPKPRPQVYVDHIHAPLVSVREQADVVVGLLRERGRATFAELTEGVDDTLTVVARFLALLELYREKAVALDQEHALGELVVIWSGSGSVTVTDEFDRVPDNTEEKQ